MVPQPVLEHPEAGVGFGLGRGGALDPPLPAALRERPALGERGVGVPVEEELAHGPLRDPRHRRPAPYHVPELVERATPVAPAAPDPPLLWPSASRPPAREARASCLSG